MPVLALTAAPLAREADERAALRRLAIAVAAALDLPEDGVVVTLVHAAPAARPTWPVLLAHGRARPPEAMAAALDAARDVVATAWGADRGAVWAQWCVDPSGPGT